MSLIVRCSTAPQARPWLFLAAVWLAASAVTAHAQNKCTATGVMAGEKFAVSNCAAALLTD